MRAGELVLVMPWLYLLLAGAALPLHIGTWQAFFLLIAMIGGVGWVRPARLVRGVVFAVRKGARLCSGRPGIRGFRRLYHPQAHFAFHSRGRPDTGYCRDSRNIFWPRSHSRFSDWAWAYRCPVGTTVSEARQYHALTAHPWMLAPAFSPCRYCLLT